MGSAYTGDKNHDARNAVEVVSATMENVEIDVPNVNSSNGENFYLLIAFQEILQLDQTYCIFHLHRLQEERLIVRSLRENGSRILRVVYQELVRNRICSFHQFWYLQYLNPM
jgi:hypothetical protein